MTEEKTATPPPTPKDVPTTEEPEIIDTEGQTVISDITPSMHHMDATILIASKLEEFGKARNAIMNFIIRQSYPGDWISHSMESVNKLDRSANLGAAGCERIANLLGIKELNWKAPKKEWSDNRLHFTYLTEADFEFAGRRIHVVHRVGTRDKFWRTEYVWDANATGKDGRKGAKVKKVTPLEDVREDYIEKASFRGARKEGVRTLMGLRNVPLLKLSELGFNIELVHYASFKDSKKEKQPESGKVIGAKAEDGSNEYMLSVKNISEQMVSKKNGKPYYIILDIGGDKFYLHADENSDRLKTLQGAAFGDYKVKIKYREHQGFKSIDEVLSVEGEETK